MVRTLWFFWNWFDFLTRGDEPRGATNLVNWMLTRPILLLPWCWVLPASGYGATRPTNELPV